MIFISNIQDAKNWTNCLIWFLSPIWLAVKNNLTKICNVVWGTILWKRESNEFSETAGLQPEHSHGVYIENINFSSWILFYNRQHLGSRYLHLLTQGSFRFPQNSKIIYVLKKKNLLPGVTKLLSNSHCRQLIWFMWRLLSWIIGPVSKRKAKKATGRGW